MGPASHFLFGALCGAALGSVAMVLAPASRRPRVALWLPPGVLACGLWAEAPYLLGVPETTARLANVFFGYAWLHPWLEGAETIAFAAAVVVANVFLLGYVAFLSWTFSTAALLRWQQEGPRGGRRRRADSSGAANGSRNSGRGHR